MAGIAHDFNNILTTISANVSLSLMELNENPEIRENLEGALTAVKRAAGLSTQLLRFSKGGEPIKQTTSIVEIIVDSTNFILAGTKIKIEYDFPNKIPNLDIDPDQISQVIQNIIINAKEAMEGTGTVKISIDVLEKTTEIPIEFNGSQYIKIILQDNGPGMDEAIQRHVLEPHFTTKSYGNGLGLSTSHQIIKNHHGWMNFQSHLGEGTAFFIYLPFKADSLTSSE